MIDVESVCNEYNIGTILLDSNYDVIGWNKFAKLRVGGLAVGLPISRFFERRSWPIIERIFIKARVLCSGCPFQEVDLISTTSLSFMVDGHIFPVHSSCVVCGFYLTFNIPYMKFHEYSDRLLSEFNIQLSALIDEQTRLRDHIEKACLPLLDAFVADRSESKLASLKEEMLRYSSMKVDTTPLTKTQSEVLKRILSGKTTNEIANELFISTKTVETHRNRIRKKLNIHNKKQSIQEYFKNVEG